MKSRDWIIIVIILLTTIFLRAYDLGNKFNFNAEFNYKLLSIKEIIYDHKIRLIGIEAVSYLHHLHYPPLALYIFAPILFASGGNPLSLEISLILLSGVTCVLIFLLTKKIFTKRVATIASILYLGSFFVQRVDRFIWVVGTMLFFTPLFLLVILEISEVKNNLKSKLYVFFLGIIIGFALNFHFQAITFIPASLIFLFSKFKGKIEYYLMLFFGLFLPLSPLILFELRHNFYNLKGVILLFGDSGNALKSSIPSIWQRTIAPFVNLPLKVFYQDANLTKTALTAAFFAEIFIIIYLLMKRNRFTKQQKLFFLTCFVLWLTGLIFFPLVQNKYYATDYYLFYLIPVFIIIITFILLELLKRFKLGIYLVYFLLTLFLLVNVKKTIEFEPRISWNQQREAVAYILSEERNSDFTIKFPDFASEELDYLFYYLSKKTGLDYSKIHYTEAWNDEKDIQFIIQLTPQNTEKIKKFGNLYVTKVN